MDQWYRLDTDAVLQRLDSRPEGLDERQVEERLVEFGPNQLEERRLRSPWSVLAAQFTEVMVVVLIVAAVISLFVGEVTDAIMILVIVVLNALLGFTQEYRAERAMEKLKQLSVPTVRVRRGGQVREIEATQLVPGDIVLVEAGSRIPADARVLESANLRVEEAALTGESVPVEKVTRAITGEDSEGSGAQAEIPLGDRRNMLYMGTAVSYGRGTGVVAATGMRTELGNIADLLQSVSEEKTPLQRRMAELGKWLALGALGIVAVVFIVGVARGEELTEMFLVAISLAVAAVPEGLPAVVTIALALGAQRMVRRHALIRKLPAVETLGSVTTICSDKTGTLTENRMTVTVLDVAGRSISLVEQLRVAGPVISPDETPLGQPDPSLAILLAGGALANDAVLAPDDNAGGYHAVGDPTEGAMVVAAARHGLWKGQLERLMPRRMEAPFSSERKRMSTVHALGDTSAADAGPAETAVRAALPEASYVVFTKGSVDGLLRICNRVWDDGAIEPMDDAWRERIEAANNGLAQEGVRVLGVALRPLDALPSTPDEGELEQQLIFVGMTGMIDPPRNEVRQAVAECRTAGIRPVMITGDHPLTALNIARELGIAAGTNGDRSVITGQQLAEMSVEELEGVVNDVSVYARVSPEHKVKIVEALKARGHFVAMTGDGVNDAPALKRADIGVAMGITGTDVSKEAADMVLLDDNFASIVHAIEEGRTIYENIRKFVRYIISCNVGEIFLMLVAPLLGFPVPLSPVQLLWINLVTDGLPALALGVDPSAPDTMQRPPNPPGESILARGLGSYILWVGVLLGVLSLIALWWGMELGGGAWQTMVFTTLSLSQMGNALAVRSDRESVFTIGLLTNKPLLGAIALTTALQLGVVYLPFAQPIFGTQALTVQQLAVTVVLSIAAFVVVEAVKLVRRARRDSHE